MRFPVSSNLIVRGYRWDSPTTILSFRPAECIRIGFVICVKVIQFDKFPY